MVFECIGDTRPLEAAFFDRDPREVAFDLLGALVVASVDDSCAGGAIVETEAYLGTDDPGSHAATKGMTKRNAVMYGPPGVAYVYFTYGNHHMLNLICGPEGVAGGVLLRAIEPRWGIESMLQRRHGRLGVELTNGPGKLAQALGIDLTDNGTTLGRGRIGVFEGEHPGAHEVGISGRIGLARGHDLQLRYFVRGSEFVSRARTGPVRKPRV